MEVELLTGSNQATADYVREHDARLRAGPGPDTAVIHCSSSCNADDCFPPWRVIHVRPQALALLAWEMPLPPWLVMFLQARESQRASDVAEGRLPAAPLGSSPGGRPPAGGAAKGLFSSTAVDPRRRDGGLPLGLSSGSMELATGAAPGL